jgi:hypothetical protein
VVGVEVARVVPGAAVILEVALCLPVGLEVRAVLVVKGGGCRLGEGCDGTGRDD